VGRIGQGFINSSNFCTFMHPLIGVFYYIYEMLYRG